MEQDMYHSKYRLLLQRRVNIKGHPLILGVSAAALLSPSALALFTRRGQYRVF
jgi:hypothetical protein